MIDMSEFKHDVEPYDWSDDDESGYELYSSTPSIAVALVALVGLVVIGVAAIVGAVDIIRAIVGVG